ncbi:ribonuclease HII [Candidatus Parcubacteria bacterium]|nr:ribonuclease HII [Candidatus Parcubacteria bacterium]
MSKKTCKYLCGIDEVGRGPIAGPVTVGLVLYQKNISRLFSKIPLLDSKKLSPQKRRDIVKLLQGWKKEGKIFFTTTSISAKDIDRIGISKAIQKALNKNLSRIEVNPKDVLVVLDGGLHAPSEYIYQETIIKGDTKNRAIAFASIMAKVTRDNYMELQSERYPEYNFAQHKGYGTKDHYKTIKKHGICALHRKSFLRNLSLK